MELNETESDSQHKHNTDFLLVDLMITNALKKYELIYVVVVVLVQVIATRNTRERSNRLENMCWRIWHLARKKKQVMRNLISHKDKDKVHM